MAKTFGVMIPTCGRPNLLKRTLDSLAKCDLPSGYLGLLVVENGPKGELESIVASAAPQLKEVYQYEQLPNKSNALNIGMRELPADFLFFTDDDVRFSPQILNCYVDAANRHGAGHFFGGPVGVDYVQSPPHWLIPFLPISARGWSLNRSSECSYSRPDFMGFNWAAFREDIEAIGGFDPRFGPGSTTGATGQESTAMQRLLKNNVQGWYLPDAKVWHYVPEDRCTPEWTRRRYYQGGLSVGYQAASSNSRRVVHQVKLALRTVLATVSPIKRKELAFRRDLMREWYRGWEEGRNGRADRSSN